jgi:putative flippase GtrA
VRGAIRRWGIFNLVGLGGFVIQLGAIAILTRAFGWSPAAATAVGVELAFLHNFIGHNRWTWSDRPATSGRTWVRRYVRYQLTKASSLAANVVVTAALTGATAIPVELANAVAVAVCALPNYVIASRFVFSGTGAETSSS